MSLFSLWIGLALGYRRCGVGWLACKLPQELRSVPRARGRLLVERLAKLLLALLLKIPGRRPGALTFEGHGKYKPIPNELLPDGKIF